MNDLAAAARGTAAQTSFRVLVVDDDPDMAGFLGLLLAKEGMKVDTVHDGEAALAHIAASPPDLVLLDVVMPGMNGFEVCGRLKVDPSTALIPVVLITALEDQASRVRGINTGADDFLCKPIRREELIARVMSLRRLHQTRRELEGRRLAAEIHHKEAIRKTISRYISPRLADRIIAESEAAPFEGNAQRINVVALFADLRGFTRLTETLEVDEVVALLNEYFAVITEAAYRHEGTIFSMAGDCMLVGFNVPVPQADAPLRAWHAAQEMIGGFSPVLARWTRRAGMSTGIGVGIAVGEAIIGNIGSPQHMSYTIIGDAVNTAARLMQLAKAGEVLVSGPAYEAIRDALPANAVEARGEVALRGKSGAVAVYSIRL